MRKPVDIEAQFEKLLPYAASYSRNLTDEQMLKLVENAIGREVNLGKGEHRAYYDLNKHLALAELRDALKREMAHV